MTLRPERSTELLISLPAVSLTLRERLFPSSFRPSLVLSRVSLASVMVAEPAAFPALSFREIVVVLPFFSPLSSYWVSVSTALLIFFKSTLPETVLPAVSVTAMDSSVPFKLKPLVPACSVSFFTSADPASFPALSFREMVVVLPLVLLLSSYFVSVAEILLSASIVTLSPAVYVVSVSTAEITLFSSILTLVPAVYLVSTAEITLFSSILTLVPAVYLVSTAEMTLFASMETFVPAVYLAFFI